MIAEGIAAAIVAGNTAAVYHLSRQIGEDPEARENAAKAEKEAVAAHWRLTEHLANDHDQEISARRAD